MVFISTWDGWVGAFHISKMKDASNGWMGRWFPYPGSARFQIQPGPGSNCSSITYNPHSAPFTITKQKLENSHNVYLPSLCIAFIALDKKRTTTRQENEEAEKNITKHTRNQDQHHHHHHHPGRVKEMIVLL